MARPAQCHAAGTTTESHCPSTATHRLADSHGGRPRWGAPRRGSAPAREEQQAGGVAEALDDHDRRPRLDVLTAEKLHQKTH